MVFFYPNQNFKSLVIRDLVVGDFNVQLCYNCSKVDIWEDVMSAGVKGATIGRVLEAQALKVALDLDKKERKLEQEVRMLEAVKVVFEGAIEERKGK